MRFLLLLLLISISFCWHPGPASALERVVLQLRWYPQFQFAGFYVALDQGYYEEAGLDVILQPYRPGLDVITEVADGRAQYGIAGPELLLARQRGRPVRVLAAIHQHSPNALAVHADSGLESPHDLAGKRVMISPRSELDIWAMLLREGVSLGSLQLSPATWDVEEFVSRSVDAMAVYLTNTPFELMERGVAFRLIRPLSYGVDFYGDCLFASEDEVDEHPERLDRFIEASLKGWAWALAHPEEAARLIMDVYGSEKTLAHLLYEAEAMSNLMLPHLVDIGHMSPSRWESMADVFVELGLLPAGTSLDGFLYPDPGRPLPGWLLGVGLAVAMLSVLSLVAALALWHFNRVLSRAVAARTLELELQVEERKQAEEAVRRARDHLEDRVSERTAELSEANQALLVEITERKRAEEDLRTNRELLERTGRMARIGGWESDAEAALVIWSDEVFRLHEVEPDFVPDHDRVMAFYEPEERALLDGAWRKLWSDGKAFDLILRMTTAKNRPIWVRLQGQASMDGGKVRKVFGTFQDITERREAELARQESENRWRILVETFRVGVVVYDANGKVTEHNPVSRELLGLTRKEMVGSTRTHPGWRVCDERGTPLETREYPVARVSASGEPVRNLLLGIDSPRHEERKWIICSADPVFLATGGLKEILVAFTDITELKQAQDKLEQTLLAAEEANRTKGEFLANMSHEFRTPMNGVIGMAELLATTDLDETQKDYLDTMLGSANALLDLLQNILDLSRIEAGRLEFDMREFNLNHLAQNILAAHHVAGDRKGLELTMSLDEDLPLMVRGDMDRIRQVLTSLMDNAVKFTEKGGVELIVRCADSRPSPEEGEDKFMDIVFEIKDTGIGIAPEHRDTIFESFRQADGSHTRRYTGSGLGLTISRKLAQAMGGRLEVESAEGQGSVFRVILPLATVEWHGDQA